jgi:hypothetical protein
MFYSVVKIVLDFNKVKNDLDRKFGKKRIFICVECPKKIHWKIVGQCLRGKINFFTGNLVGHFGSSSGGIGNPNWPTRFDPQK